MQVKNNVVLDLPSQTGNPRNSEGAFLKCGDGSILYLFSRYDGNSWHDAAAANLAARISTDNGESWSPRDEMVISRETAANIMSCSFLTLPSGRILLLYLRKDWLDRAKQGQDGLSEGEYTCIPQRRFSDDGGRTWSAAEPVILFPGYYVVNNDRLLRLNSGRLLLPVAHHRHSQKNGKQTFGTGGIADVYYSDDDGISWNQAPESVYPPPRTPGGLQEPGLVELSDGHVMMYCRTQRGFQYKAFSADGGLSWSGAEPAYEFPSPLSPMLIKRNPYTKELFAIWNDIDPRWNFHTVNQQETWGRTPLALAISSDNGKSWHDHVLLETDPGRGFCYPSLLFLTADTFLYGTCCGGYGRGCLQDSHVVKISLTR